MLCPGCDFFERLSITCVGDTVIYSVVEHMGFSGKLYSIKNYFTYIEYYSSVSSYKSHSSNSYFGENVQSQEFETKYRLCAQESSTYTRHGCMNIKINSTQKNLLENMFIFLWQHAAYWRKMHWRGYMSDSALWCKEVWNPDISQLQWTRSPKKWFWGKALIL